MSLRGDEIRALRLARFRDLRLGVIASRVRAQPSIRIIDQAYLGAVPAIRTELSDARTDQSQIEKGDAAPGPPLKTKVTGRPVAFAPLATKAV
jgi:hypothetical protein